MTEMEAYAVKSRQSEPVGSRGKGTLLLERKASGAIQAYYRERTPSSDKRFPLGTLVKKPRPSTEECDLGGARAEALRIATEAGTLGGLVKYLEHRLKREEVAAAEWFKAQQQAEIAARRGTLGELLDSYVESMKRAGRISAKDVANTFKLHVKQHNPQLTARIAADIEPEDIQLILAGVLRRKPNGRGKGHKAAGACSNGMRTTCDKLRRYLQAAFSYAAKAHLTPERLAEDGKVFAIRSNPVRDVLVTQGIGAGHTESLTRGSDERGQFEASLAGVAGAVSRAGGRQPRK